MLEEKPFGATADPAAQADGQPDQPGPNGQTGPSENENAPDHDSPLSEDYGHLDSDDGGPPPGWAPGDPPPEMPDPADPEATEATEASEANAAPEAPDWEADAKRYQDQYLRSLAELENAKRRFQKEKEENARYASESVIRDLVPFLNNLNLALSYADDSDPGVRNLAEGVRMTLKDCLDKLADRGLKEIEAKRGDPFDPNVHEAIGQEIDPALPDKAVTKTVSKGYSLHGRLLSPARVLVNKNPTQ
jgi:molecular chaperone GrpE